MRNSFIKQSLFLFFAFALIASVGLSETESVKNQTAKVRETPAPLGKIIATLSYGDAVEVLEKQGIWRKVSLKDGQIGWIHEADLSAKKIVLSSGESVAHANASEHEVALAGKGFNSDVEKQFKNNNKELDFTWIDKMVQINIPVSEMQSFMKEGGVSTTK
jgi:uncharacterized protein YgiM (DUF1202 family)